MLRDMPLPPGFDATALENSARTNDRYQLGAQVVSAVFCGWMQHWIDAKASGDDAARQAAVSAMQSSHGWSVLIEMQADGAYPEVLWQYADAVAGSGTVVGGKMLTVEDSYRDALGCRR
jgi:hypothetical protein